MLENSIPIKFKDLNKSDTGRAKKHLPRGIYITTFRVTGTPVYPSLKTIVSDMPIVVINVSDLPRKIKPSPHIRQISVMVG